MVFYRMVMLHNYPLYMNVCYERSKLSKMHHDFSHIHMWHLPPKKGFGPPNQCDTNSPFTEPLSPRDT